MTGLDLLGAALGLVTGGTMAVAVSCVWCVLQLPARVQDRLRAASSRLLALAMAAGLELAALQGALGFSLRLPALFGGVALLFGGMFVGMVASALEEILEVAPVLMHRFRLGDMSLAFRWTLLLGKALGAVLASLLFTL